jgi:iron complex outermembrane receptor protein
VGSELTLRFNWKRVNAWGNVAVEGAITRGKFDDRPAALYPRATSVIGLEMDVHEAYFKLGSQVRVAGGRGASQSNVFLNNDQFYELPAYAVWDLTLASHALHLFDSRAETRLLATGRNLIGTQYFDPGFGGFDLPSLGRTFYFELRQTF